MAEIEPIIPQSDSPGYAWGHAFPPEELFTGHLAKPHEDVNSFGSLMTRNPDLAEELLNRRERGWWFTSGDPEFWKFENLLLVSGGRALDLGMGSGRTSIPFALRGMSVVGYDDSELESSGVQAMVEAYPFLPIEVRSENIKTADFGENEYDTVLLGQVFNHMSSKQAAYEILEKAIRATKSGGHLWIRTGGKEDSMYKIMRAYSEWDPSVEKVDDDVFVHADHGGHHGSHGGHEGSYALFFDQTEIHAYLASHGLKIVHSQIIPEVGQMNIMFGEDWNKDMEISQGGMITLIARKA